MSYSAGGTGTISLATFHFAVESIGGEALRRHSIGPVRHSRY